MVHVGDIVKHAPAGPFGNLCQAQASKRSPFTDTWTPKRLQEKRSADGFIKMFSVSFIREIRYGFPALCASLTVTTLTLVFRVRTLLILHPHILGESFSRGELFVLVGCMYHSARKHLRRSGPVRATAKWMHSEYVSNMFVHLIVLTAPNLKPGTSTRQAA